jgi:hypothetical protein
MITYEELHQQNHKITELTNVLRHLISDRFLCDSDITRTLFFRYVDSVKEHLEIIDSKLYPKLMTHGEQKVRNTADRIRSGSTEIKRIFAAYLKDWCRTKNKTLMIKDYDLFLKDTEEMFEIVLNRIQIETENLYPLIREITGDQETAA